VLIRELESIHGEVHAGFLGVDTVRRGLEEIHENLNAEPENDSNQSGPAGNSSEEA
jgi:hypothetical protein